MLLIIAITTFVCVTLAMVGVYWLLNRPQSAGTERLKRLGQTSGASMPVSVSITEDEGATNFAKRIATPLNRLVPASAAEVQKLQKMLMQAGFRSPNAPLTYRTIQLVLL